MGTHGSNGSSIDPSTWEGTSSWDKARMMFQLSKPTELLRDVFDLRFLGSGGYGKVFKVRSRVFFLWHVPDSQESVTFASTGCTSPLQAVWRSTPVALKLVPSNSLDLFKSSSFKEALLCKEL
jgi:hypothetical protein